MSNRHFSSRATKVEVEVLQRTMRLFLCTAFLPSSRSSWEVSVRRCPLALRVINTATPSLPRCTSGQETCAPAHTAGTRNQDHLFLGSRRLKEPVLDQTRKINRRTGSQWQSGLGSKVKGLCFLSRQTSVWQPPPAPTSTSQLAILHLLEKKKKSLDFFLNVFYGFVCDSRTTN